MGEPEDPAVQGTNKAFETPPSGGDQQEWAGPTAAAEESPEGSPEDVGDSKRRSAEDIAESEDEEGRTTEGTQGPSGRPYGKAEPEGASGVDPQGPVTEGPNLPPP
jgi:hypothetical protein